MTRLNNLPPQLKSFSQKGKEWRKQHLDWADNNTYFNSSLVRRNVLHKKINYDLINGRLNMQDMVLVLNPDKVQASFIPDQIQHYPIMNSKLNVLRGEEAKRVFDFKVIVTNPTSISEIENNKKELIFAQLQELIANTSASEEEFNSAIEEMDEYFAYEWQDIREVRANALLNHYVKEYNMPLMFNQGFVDAMTIGEEIYQCDIIGGEPYVERINPLRLRCFKSGYSSKLEDADIIIIEDYWQPSRIIDTFYDVLTREDLNYIQNLPDHSGQEAEGSMDNIDERDSFVLRDAAPDGSIIDGDFLFTAGMGVPGGNHMYYDNDGNIRVLKMYWKSKRKIKKITSFDPMTGADVVTFYPETYVTDKDNGEVEEIFWINEAWEGTKIGEKIYVNMRPRIIQYNVISNPSKCHFGIVGSIYSLNENRPYSLVDMMKPYNYLYNAIHDRLNKAIAANWGKLLEVDLASIPKGWEIDKWMYYAKINHILVKDSFKEGNIGAATGKLSGQFASNTRGAIDLETGNYIQQHINLLEFIKMEMSEVAGITRQREGQISNRETVGGVERATLQSSHITEWLFTIHDDVKKRVLECFLETAKIALKGGSKKFQYLLSDMSMKVMDIEGDEFAESDYGLVVDNSNFTQTLNDKLDVLAQAALQNQTLSFSTIMRLYSSSSLAEKQRMIEKDERDIIERNQQAQQQQIEAQQQMQEMQMQQLEADRAQKDAENIRDNETKILIETMKQAANTETADIDYTPEEREKLLKDMEALDAKMKLDREKFELDKVKHKDDVAIKRAALSKKTNTNK